MLDRVLPDLIIRRGGIGSLPQHACRLDLARMLRHLGRHHTQERMRFRHFGAALECLGGSRVILQVHVVNES